MKIWVDADACPVVIKDILFRAAERTGVQLTLVANQPVRIPPSRYIKFIQVAAGFDVADDEIVKRLAAGDLVITADDEDDWFGSVVLAGDMNDDGRDELIIGAPFADGPLNSFIVKNQLKGISISFS